jgi:predicted Fe-Mo cluster-binding NifX family protein
VITWSRLAFGEVQGEVTMKIAVPLFEERVSPYFGSSSKMLFFDAGSGSCPEFLWDVGGEGAMDIARRLVDLGVEILICGGIPEENKDWLVKKGVMVVENQKGNAREVVNKILKRRKNERRQGN